ncbi:phosphoglycerate mutase [Anaeramoeba flamelloides]|uniref:phosphoglycerate mutase (2,3-diphosphoglycerate-dependent) n=1 Tax=Anaeramoeba flamelloides TaxID=1746091 RepID=A0AAV7YAS7_9EUKA|nr:phosphoglycerate mutase [Anaeramoeba flamelloides]KAJ3426913.1 phosphoglycerate mutase [Anaeramoeba flamelloides]KAJ6243199.1 phosphoglycerate mutase [Anaeramoeba flamelloides]KAJ6248155.1 phosphoglycerate mutase [Anaeramoeba flamelloides]
MYKVVFIRHGESVWNKENVFTGWTNVALSEKGEKEAKEGGIMLKEKGYTFDVAYTSVLKRANDTLDLVLKELELSNIPITKSWRLNERHYGALQGKNKAKTVEEEGLEQVMIWRRSYSTPPPPLTKEDERYPGNDPLYKDLNEDELPLTECLKDTVERALPFWNETIVPSIKNGKKVIVAAHGNSLRAICKYLDDMSEEEICKLNIPTGVPLVYELNEEMKPIKHYYLADEEALQEKINAVVNQVKK